MERKSIHKTKEEIRPELTKWSRRRAVLVEWASVLLRTWSQKETLTFLDEGSWREGVGPAFSSEGADSRIPRSPESFLICFCTNHNTRFSSEVKIRLKQESPSCLQHFLCSETGISTHLSALPSFCSKWHLYRLKGHHSCFPWTLVTANRAWRVSVFITDVLILPDIGGPGVWPAEMYHPDPQCLQT